MLLFYWLMWCRHGTQNALGPRSYVHAPHQQPVAEASLRVPTSRGLTGPKHRLTVQLWMTDKVLYCSLLVKSSR